MNDYDKKDTVIMPSTRILQSRVGTGKIKQKLIDKGQKKIDILREHIDEEPFAIEHIEETKKLSENLKNNPDQEDLTDKIALSVMNFKSNIGMFGKQDTTRLASIMLRWIESVENIDKDVHDVLDGYITTLGHIYLNDVLKDDQLHIIIGEMEAACQRYFDKHPELELTAVIDNDKAFYINKQPEQAKDLHDELSDENLVDRSKKK